MLRHLLFAAFLSVLALPVSAEDGQLLRVTQDGVERVVWMVDARADTSQPAALVLAIHGYRNPQDAAAMQAEPASLAWPTLREEARTHGFVALFPAAYQGQWALFDGLPKTTAPDGRAIDDEAFLLALVQSAISDGIADPTRIYVTGISDGAIMTYRLICLSDTPFAAAAPLIGSAYEGHIKDCTPKTPPALMHVHGTADKVLPYDGWLFPKGREVSVPEVMEHWRLLHGCTGQARQVLEDIMPEDGSTVEEMTWTGCARENTVKRYKVVNGGHAVPNARRVPSEDDPRVFNRDLDTYAVMWRFFAANPRGAAP